MAAPPPLLDLTELRSFVVLAEQRHFGRAAQMVGISQPALSKRLQRLEDKVGGALLFRGPRGVGLTEPGRVLFQQARSLLRTAELAVERSQQAARGESGRLRIGFGIASVTQLLPEVLLRFSRAHPAVQLDLRDLPSAAQVEALRDDEIDLGFLRDPPAGPEFSALPMVHEHMVVARPQRAPWREGASLRALAGKPFIICSRQVSSSYFDHVIGLCRAAGFAPRVVTETNEFFSLLQLVRAGIGFALVPASVSSMRVPGIRYSRVKDAAAAWTISLTFRTRPRQALIDGFVAIAQQVYRDVTSGRPVRRSG